MGIGWNTRGLLLGAACLTLLAYALYRDLHLEGYYSGDLRNRIVGARMMKDGISPYFYKWKRGDGLRYYDPNNFDSLPVSNITSTPFLHRLLIPIADYREVRAARIWMVIEYILYLSIAAMAFGMEGRGWQRLWVLIFSGIFLLTEAWKLHVFNGQVYIIIPALAMGFFFFLWLAEKYLRSGDDTVLSSDLVGCGLAAGTMAAGLVLVKPYAIFFFLPFLLPVLKYPRAFLVSLFVPAIILGAWILTDKKEWKYWKDYRQNVAIQIKFHQDLPDALRQVNEPDPSFSSWEGIKMDQILDMANNHPPLVYSENGNVFVIIRNLFHYSPPVGFLAGSGICIILVLTGVFYCLYYPYSLRSPTPLPDLAPIGILGFCLYMIADLFSPVYRHQYYTIQWLFPLLLAAMIYQPRLKWAFAFLMGGLLLNIGHISFIRMEHTIGELIILAALLYIAAIAARPTGQT